MSPTPCLSAQTANRMEMWPHAIDSSTFFSNRGFCLSYLPWPKFMCEQFFAHTEQNETCELNEFDSSGKFHGANVIMCKLPCSKEIEHIWMQVRRDNSIKLLGIPSSLKASKQLRKIPACDGKYLSHWCAYFQGLFKHQAHTRISTMLENIYNFFILTLLTQGLLV